MRKLITLFIGACLCTALFSFAPTLPQSNSPSYFYKGSYDNLLRDSKRFKKIVLLDFWASWCAPCAKMDRETFTDRYLAAFLSQDFMVYKVDIDTPEGKEIVAKYDVKLFPTMLVFNPRIGKVYNFKGFYPADFLQKELIKIKSNNTIYQSAPDDIQIVAKK